MIEEIEKDDHALKPFFDVVLYDENDQPLSWTKGLVQSVNYPTFSFVVNDQNAGTSRGYEGWTLPDALSITMYETRKRELEQYLLDWAFGEKGIFDLDNGNFRAVEKESYLFRQIMFRTTTFEVSLQGKLEHAAIDISNVVAYSLKTAIDSLAGGKLTLQMEDFIAEKSEEFANNILQENMKKKENILLMKKQQMPIVDKLIKMGEMVTNQLTSRVPLGRSISVPVVIPPPLLQVPANMNFNLKSIVGEALNFTPKPNLKAGKGFTSGLRILSTSGLGGSSSTSKSVLSTAEGMRALKEGAKKVDQILSQLPKATSKEIATSTSIYKVALQSYSADSYSYETGGAVSYTLNLPLVDYKKPQFS